MNMAFTEEQSEDYNEGYTTQSWSGRNECEYGIYYNTIMINRGI